MPRKPLAARPPPPPPAGGMPGPWPMLGMPAEGMPPAGPEGNIGMPAARPPAGDPPGVIMPPKAPGAGAGAAGEDIDAKGSKEPGPSWALAVAGVAKGSKPPMAEGAEGVGPSKRPAPAPPKRSDDFAAGADTLATGGGGAFACGVGAGTACGFGAGAFAVPAKRRDSKSCGSAGAAALVSGGFSARAAPASTCRSFLASSSFLRAASTR
mmetsp:Transcript_1857/g.4132  ORF Transcript_1857/g.4132 Transcript_1857/m.4132 type:complete len:210 (-) Transcript_1857:1795-2424(-)